MAYDLSTLSDYSWADIAKAAKVAMIKAALGGANLTINGRALGRISIKDAKLLYDTAIENVNDEAADTSGGIALVEYREHS